MGERRDFPPDEREGELVMRFKNSFTGPVRDFARIMAVPGNRKLALSLVPVILKAFARELDTEAFRTDDDGAHRRLIERELNIIRALLKKTGLQLDDETQRRLAMLSQVVAWERHERIRARQRMPFPKRPTEANLCEYLCSSPELPLFPNNEVFKLLSAEARRTVGKRIQEVMAFVWAPIGDGLQDVIERKDRWFHPWWAYRGVNRRAVSFEHREGLDPARHALAFDVEWPNNYRLFTRRTDCFLPVDDLNANGLAMRIPVGKYGRPWSAALVFTLASVAAAAHRSIRLKFRVKNQLLRYGRIFEARLGVRTRTSEEMAAAVHTLIDVAMEGPYFSWGHAVGHATLEKLSAPAGSGQTLDPWDQAHRFIQAGAVDYWTQTPRFIVQAIEGPLPVDNGSVRENGSIALPPSAREVWRLSRQLRRRIPLTPAMSRIGASTERGCPMARSRDLQNTLAGMGYRPDRFLKASVHLLSLARKFHQMLDDGQPVDPEDLPGDVVVCKRRVIHPSPEVDLVILDEHDPERARVRLVRKDGSGADQLFSMSEWLDFLALAKRSQEMMPPTLPYQSAYPPPGFRPQRRGDARSS